MRVLPHALPAPAAVHDGHIKRVTDEDIQSSVLEIAGTNVSTSYITCPSDPAKTLGIKLPFLVMIVKNLNKYFTFEVQVLDDKNVRRRFRASNYQVQAVGAGREAWSSAADSTSLWWSPKHSKAPQAPNSCCPTPLQSTTRVKPFICTMPMRLDEGWNQVQVSGQPTSGRRAVADRAPVHPQPLLPLPAPCSSTWQTL